MWILPPRFGRNASKPAVPPGAHPVNRGYGQARRTARQNLLCTGTRRHCLLQPSGRRRRWSQGSSSWRGSPSLAPQVPLVVCEARETCSRELLCVEIKMHLFYGGEAVRHHDSWVLFTSRRDVTPPPQCRSVGCLELDVTARVILPYGHFGSWMSPCTTTRETRRLASCIVPYSDGKQAGERDRPRDNPEVAAPPLRS